MADSIDEMLAEEFDRITVLDAALDLQFLLKSTGALKAVLEQARDDAHLAVNKLIKCKPEDADTIRELQWDVRRFDKLCQYIFNILEAGKAMSADLTEEQIAETEKLLMGDEAQPKDA